MQSRADDYDGEGIALVGLPSDANSSFLRGSAEAPGVIRAELGSEATHRVSENGLDLGAPGALFDAGDLDAGSDGRDLDAIERVVGRLVERGARVLALGGDHAVTLPLVRAYRRTYEVLDVLHLDAHPDLYDDFGGNPHSHASPFARLLEEGLVRRLVQVGIRSLNEHLRAQVERFGVEVIEMRDWERAEGLSFDGPVYLSVDLDVLDPAFAPGVSHREPGGASTRQVIDLIHGVRGEVVGADVVELNPGRDPSGVSATVAARVVRELGGRLLANRTRTGGAGGFSTSQDKSL